MQLPCTEMCVMFGHVVFEIHEQTDRQTDRQTAVTLIAILRTFPAGGEK